SSPGLASGTVLWYNVQKFGEGPRAAAPRRNTMNHTVPCPSCGRMADITEGRDACFCTFCGARVTRPAPEATAAPAKVSGEEAAAIAGELAELMARSRHLAQQFGKATYADQFQSYRAQLEPLMVRLEDALPQGFYR